MSKDILEHGSSEHSSIAPSYKKMVLIDDICLANDWSPEYDQLYVYLDSDMVVMYYHGSITSFHTLHFY